MTRRFPRWVLGLAAVSVMFAVALGLSACASAPAMHLVADQACVLEAGRAMEVSELTLRLCKLYVKADPERWSPLITPAAQLSQSAGQMQMNRATAVMGSRSDADQFYALVGPITAALRSQREALAKDLIDALPKPPP